MATKVPEEWIPEGTIFLGERVPDSREDYGDPEKINRRDFMLAYFGAGEGDGYEGY